jgi:predicted kinase
MLALCPPAGHAPLVLALAGLPGAGKSTLAARLAAATRWSILDRDQIRAELSPGDVSDAAREAADRLLLRRVGSGVRAAMNLIVDGKTFARAADRARLQDEIDDAGGECQWCWLDLPAELAIERIQLERSHPAPDRDAALVRAVAARFEPLSDAAWRFDARLAPEELAQMLVLRVATRLNAILIDVRD